MANSKLVAVTFGLAAVLSPSAFAAPANSSGQYTVLHAFAGSDGENPFDGVTVGVDGSLYGATSAGGSSDGVGTIFKSDPTGNIVTLHAFDVADGQAPEFGSLTLLQDTLYGSAAGGGPVLCGTLYSLKTDGSDFNLLYSFSGKDGCAPIGTLQRLPGSGFVGVTINGGPGFQGVIGAPSGKGVLFALTRAAKLRVLHTFGQSGDGEHPNFVVADAAGHVFGSTGGGGACSSNGQGCGMIFEYDVPTGQYSILYAFTGENDGSGPILGSIGADGTLYGATTGSAGRARYGTVFALTPSGSKYTLNTLAYSSATLSIPTSGPTLTQQGRLVGVTQYGLYTYNAHTGGLRVLQDLTTAATGYAAYGQPVVAKNGDVYGTTDWGGEPACGIQDGCGVLYRYVP